MPRPKSPPSYCIHTRSNRAYTTIEGRQIQLGAASSPESQQAFDRILGEWYANGQQLPQEAPVANDAHRDGPSVAVLLERFWTHAQGYYSRPVLDDAGQPKADAGIGLTEPTEQLNHYRQVIRLTRRAYGDTDILKFGCPQLEALREMMIRPRTDPATGEAEAAWCRKHANRQAGRVKHIFGWGVIKGLVPVAVYHTLLLLPGLHIGKSVAKEKASVRPVLEEKALAVAKHANKQIAAMIQMQLLCGMRSTEVCIMRPCDIDQSKTPWQYTPMFHKTQEHDIGRSIPIGPRAREKLTPFLDRPATAFCFSPIEAERHGGVLHKKRIDEKTTPLSCGNRPGTNRKKKPQRARGRGSPTQLLQRRQARVRARFQDAEGIPGDAGGLPDRGRHAGGYEAKGGTPAREVSQAVEVASGEFMASPPSPPPRRHRPAEGRQPGRCEGRAGAHQHQND